MSKGQGLSLNTIVVAAIVLVVMVVLILIFTGRMGAWVEGVTGEEVQTCKGAGGTLTPMTTGCAEGTVQIFNVKEVPAGQVCCADES